jgi:hypothetical protein
MKLAIEWSCTKLPGRALFLFTLAGSATAAFGSPAPAAPSVPPPSSALSPWQVVKPPEPFFTIAHAGSQFAAIRLDGAVFTSPDAITWTMATAPLKDWSGYLFCRRDSFLCAVANRKGLYALSSPGGSEWRFVSVPNENDDRFRPVTHADGKYLGVDECGTVLISSDGISWTIETRFTHDLLRDVAYGRGVWVIVGAAGSIFSSSDARHWTKRTSTTEGTLGSIVYADGRFVTVTDSVFGRPPGDGYGTILSSVDGITWTQAHSARGLALHAVTHGANRYVVVGEGTVLLSQEVPPNPQQPVVAPPNEQVIGVLGRRDYDTIRVVRLNQDGELRLSEPIKPTNDDVFHYPRLTLHGPKVSDLVPSDWTLQASAVGDLNGDGLEDAVVLLEHKHSVIAGGPQHQLGWTQPNLLAVALRKTTGQDLRVVVEDTSVFPLGHGGEYSSSHFGIAKGILSIQFVHSRGFKYGEDQCTTATYKFRYQQGGFALIGAEIESNEDAAPDSVISVSINLLTGRKITTTGRRKSITEKVERIELPVLGGNRSWNWQGKVPMPSSILFDEP